MKNDATSLEISPLAFDFGLNQARRQVLARILPTVVGQRGGIGAYVHRHRGELLEVRGDIGAPNPRITFVQ
jgi:hypothetical protein